MTIRHHPSNETLIAYTAGTLDLGRRLVVASHVERCAACRGFVHGLEKVAGVMLEDLSPAPMSADALAHMLARIDREPAARAAKSLAAKPLAPAHDEPGLPACLAPYEMGRWRWVGPGVQMRPVLVPETGKLRVFLLKGAPGIHLPQHSHEGSELTSILVGSYHHEGGDFRAGDFEEADADVEHRPIVGKDKACICLVALEGQLKLSGFIGSLLNPFVRL
ncbi:MAG: cupin domain-containing protein [Proteobacteria bacterium]|nr:cupin domain-containing protein [Pseudomonadota bacterium]